MARWFQRGERPAGAPQGTSSREDEEEEESCPRWLMTPFVLESLGVKSLLRQRSYWEPWCSGIVALLLALGRLGVELFTSPFALGRLGTISLPREPTK